MMSQTDPLKDEYRQAIVENPRRQVHLANQDVALLCIDLQYLDAARDHGLFAHPDTSGVSAEGQTYYFDRLERPSSRM